ncbi:MAG TPA: divergent polysaccharide deacetylase family protein [Acidobacteriota bacterium]|nr:divergent polysaccharide deacetylase family protein [Acidobacteriota bacterium]
MFGLAFLASLFFADLFASQEYMRLRPSVPAGPAVRPEVFHVSEHGFLPPSTQSLSRVSIIIDDLGETSELRGAVLKVRLPLTLAILPGCQYSRDSALWAHNHGYEVMVHLPMEPEKYPVENPGPDALFSAMRLNDLINTTERAIDDIPYASGVNNHMGSRFTKQRAKLAPVLDIIASRGLYFIDSRTSARSIGYELAKEKGIRSGERTLFLDDPQDKETIEMRLAELIALARRDGQAVAIGHFRSATLAALQSLDASSYPDIRFTYASEITQ